jgi:hypothetical protein
MDVNELKRKFKKFLSNFENLWFNKICIENTATSDLGSMLLEFDRSSIQFF